MQNDGDINAINYLLYMWRELLTLGFLIAAFGLMDVDVEKRMVKLSQAFETPRK